MTIATFNLAVLSHVMYELKNGNLRYCEQFGFTSTELHELDKLTTDELHHLSQTKTPFIKIGINHDLFNKMISCAKNHAETQKIMDNALILGGSIELLENFFGEQSAKISERRRLLGQSKSAGRRSTLDTNESSKIWYKWKAVRDSKLNLDSLDALNILMQIAESTKVDLTTVWKLVMSWEREQQDE
ncbi:hypothetical protein CEP48_00165 [Mergibacter septicus]|uniref:Uncharacterized protein n=2 Tax=Mergibacter septicus TaxID=221402 RepID=A0A8D4IZ35_9PAST|nr:DUF2857 domain-containing protein [Mergibacter septicus]AWX14697.1 hypothetical protein CEP47_00165 [Mergibacter septicus]QDJ13948.1 hypothetical protein CEP48_00165 [Mergibacter septicus]UTU48924.1 DUF2857 domain-containing protein [Mergibacter septicus]WMR95769.1 DUF2857 domain-containing protein [Mergibacter septicus]